MMYLEKVGMAPYINAKPKQLSGRSEAACGHCQSACHGAGADPFLTRPTSALDPQMVGEVLEVMRGAGERRHDHDHRHP